MGGIYCILCLPTGKFYIGSAVNFAKRFRHHRWYLRRGTHRNHYLQRAFCKYGADAFLFAILEIVEDGNGLRAIEQRVIDQTGALQNGFNLAGDAQAPNQGRKHSVETLTIMSEQKRGALNPMHGVRLMGKQNGMFGKKRSVESRRLQSQTMTGQSRSPHTEATKLKISKAKKGKPSYRRTPEMNARMSAIQKELHG